MATTALGDRVLRRALRIDGRAYTLMLDDDGFKLTEKGRRLGLEIRWAELVSGEAALAAALEASLTAPVGRREPRSTGDGTRSRNSGDAARPNRRKAPTTVPAPGHVRGARPPRHARRTAHRVHRPAP